MSTTKTAAAPKFTSSVKPTSFSLHPETVARLRLTSDKLSKQYGRTISMSKIIERAAHGLMNDLEIRLIKRVSNKALDEAHTARARKKISRTASTGRRSATGRRAS